MGGSTQHEPPVVPKMPDTNPYEEVREFAEAVAARLEAHAIAWTLEDVGRLARLAADIRVDVAMLVDTLARVEELLEDAVDADRTRDVRAATVRPTGVNRLGRLRFPGPSPDSRAAHPGASSRQENQPSRGVTFAFPGPRATPGQGSSRNGSPAPKRHEGPWGGWFTHPTRILA
jgi:hypothetical protein